jgi:hypothetical protein
MLYEVKSNASYKTQTAFFQSGETTPILECTTSKKISEEPESRKASMRENVIVLAHFDVNGMLNCCDKVLKRQGYRCPLTNVPDERFPGPLSEDEGSATLRCTHILKPAAAAFPSSELDKSCVSSFRHRRAVQPI